MTTLREAAQQALEALEHSLTFVVIEAKRAVRNDCADATIREAETAEHQHRVAITALKAALAEQVQEPVAVRWRHPQYRWTYEDSKPGQFYAPRVEVQRLYTVPPQRKPLTGEELQAIYREFMLYQDGLTPSGLQRVARAIERAHGIGGQDESA